MDHERMVATLEATGRFRVMRRVPAPAPSAWPGPPHAAKGVVVDTETTGLSHAGDEIVEIGMAAFAYDPATLALGPLTGTFSALRQPSRPLPAAVTRLTGIADADVAGKTVDAKAVRSFVAGANLVIANNGAFDRPFCEAAWPVFETLPWAGSLDGVDWRGEGFEGRRLKHLLGERLLFHDGHRALDDCLALLHLLRLPLPSSGTTAFALIAAGARVDGVRIWAERAPFEAKNLLSGRGYRWSPGSDGAPRAWTREVPESLVGDELGFLRAEVYRDPDALPPVARVTALERFSPRAGLPGRAPWPKTPRGER